MGRRPLSRPLQVLLNGRLVGWFTRRPDGAIVFRYDDSWLDWPPAIAISLSLPLREESYRGDTALAVFDNLLPDDVGIRRRLAERVGAAGSDPFSLLTAVGRDCVGALQFLPEGEEPAAPGKPFGRTLKEAEVGALLARLGTAPLGMDRDAEFRISLAGAQEKTALLHLRGRWLVPHGTSATTHILKPQIGRLRNGIDLSHSVENEHVTMRLVESLGLPVAGTEIRDFGSSRALVVERFDRLWTEDGRLLRLPQEDCCQALGIPSARKYESEGGPGIAAILKLLQGSDDPQTDRALFFKAQVVFWLVGATDGHAKNFSIHLNARGGFRLTPLYDVLSVQPMLDAGQLQSKATKLAMAVGHHRHYRHGSIAPRHFLQSAADGGLPTATAEAIFGEVIAAADKVEERLAPQIDGPEQRKVLDSLLSGLRQRLRLFDIASL